MSIASPDRGAVAEAERQIQLIIDPPTAEVGAVYEGRVVNITKFGAFVNILPGRDGLVHISKLGAGKRIDRVEDVLELGQPLTVVVEDVDPNGKISLKPAGDAPVEKPVEKPAEQAAVADEVEDGPGGSDDGSDADEAPEGVQAADLPGDDGDDAYDVDGNGAYDDDTDYAPAGPERVEVGFEAAFSAELEAVHGDLGVAVPSNRGGGGGRRRRGR